jgi:hypothetical protein
MITTIARAAHGLDQWLQRKLGRPYRIVLSVGLIIEIIRRLMELPEKLASAQRLAGLMLVLALDLALLIHQIGEISERIGANEDGSAPAESRRT